MQLGALDLRINETTGVIMPGNLIGAGLVMHAAPRACALSALLLLGACIPVEPFTPAPRPTAEFPNIAYADWTEFEPEYRL